MKKRPEHFEGFNADTFKFLKDLSSNNNIAWFNNNRERYQNNIVTPARRFVNDLADFFNRLNPAIRTAPKFNETLMRINNDMRFSIGNPYKNYFLIHFGRFKLDSEFYVYLDGESCQIGLFINNSRSQAEQDFFFYKNMEEFHDEFTLTCKKFRINNEFELYDFKKDFSLIERSFNAEHHAVLLNRMKMFLFQRTYDLDESNKYSSDLIIESIKIFSKLYPIYCFSISPNPLKLIEDFENNFGIIS